MKEGRKGVEKNIIEYQIKNNKETFLSNQSSNSIELSTLATV